MKTIFVITILYCFYCCPLLAQSGIAYRDGYVLNGKDTVWCKVNFSIQPPNYGRYLGIIVNNVELIDSGRTEITGFGFEEEGQQYDYGVVRIERQYSREVFADTVFARKLVAGAIDLYEYNYMHYYTRRSSNNTTTVNVTDYYIAKADSASTLAMPVLLSKLKKREIAGYVSDNPDLYAKLQQRKMPIQKLVAILQEYNRWHKNKRRYD